MQATKQATKSVSKQAKLIEALQKGDELTAAQITARFGLANPTSTVHDIRHAGYVVYANTKRNSKGEQVIKYRMGKPTRKLISAGYLALSMGLVN